MRRAFLYTLTALFFCVFIIFLINRGEIAPVYKDTGRFVTSSVFEAQIESEGDGAKEEKSSRQLPFLPQEKFRYGIFLGGFKIGESIITFQGREIIEGKEAIFITMESSAPNFSDYEEIYGDMEDFTPLLVKRKVRLFGENMEITEEYDQEKKEVVITRKSKETTVERISSEEKIHNIILFLYSFRTQESFEIGDNIVFNLPTKNMEMFIADKTSIKTPKGRFDAFYLKSRPPKFRAWFSSDSDLIPLRIDGAVGFGNTSLILIE